MTTLDLELKINPTYEKLIPPPTDEDYQGLYDSIKEEGLKIPIAVNQDKIILDGHTRYKICKELGKEIKIIEYNFDTPEDELNFVIDANLERRHLTTWARCLFAYSLKPIYATEAEKQRRKKISDSRRADGDGIPSPSQKDDSKTRDKICKKAKVNKETYSLAEFIIKKSEFKHEDENENYDKPDDELDQKIQEIFNEFNIEKGRIKKGETVKLFPDQLKPLRTLYRSYQKKLANEIIHELKNQKMGIERAQSLVKGWDSEIKLKITEQIPKTDIELMAEFDKNPRPYDVWNFKLDSRFGKPYPGQIPADIIFQTLYFYTEQGNKVVDPMAGGGVTGDVCNVMNRKCIMYDINPTSEEIIKHNIDKGLPEQAKDAELVFWDPPYYKKMAEDYDSPGSIAALSKKEYLKIFSKAAQDFHKKGIKKVALLMSDYDDEYNNNSKDNIFLWDYINEFCNNGMWRVHRRIQCPLSTEQIRPSTIENYRKNKKLARLGRDLIIFFRQ